MYRFVGIVTQFVTCHNFYSFEITITTTHRGSYWKENYGFDEVPTRGSRQDLFLY